VKRGRGGAGRLRLTAGRHGGRVLAVPRDVRPTGGRVREALFSIWGERVEGARVLELFAGSGAVALEALGRGAAAATAVERDARALAALAANAEALGERAALTVRRGALPAELARLARAGEGPFDLVFADPPYRFGDYPGLLAGVAPLLAAGGEVVLEHSVQAGVPDEAAGLVRVDRRRYGESALSFYRPSRA
jgi:16S rRNA (guanine(966)-N(2))-methyltransferase RsmD